MSDIDVLKLTNLRTYAYPVVVCKPQHDGDTWYVNIDQGFDDWKMNQHIRLFGINTPEVYGAQKPEGDKVTTYVREKWPVGTKLTMLTLKNPGGSDKAGKYGRFLGIFIDEEGLNVNNHLLEQGMAEVPPYI